jgi:hypothetical protein
LDIEIHMNLIPTKRVVPLCHACRRREFTTVTRCAVVIEDDLAVEVF